MDFFSVTVYGLVQGISEFFPISSSAHLALLPKLLGINDPGISFDVMMHLGTACSLIVYFRRAYFSYIKNLPTFWNGTAPQDRWVKNIFFSVVSTFILVFILKKYALEYGRGINIIIFNLIFFGILMAVVDFFCPQSLDSVMTKPGQYKRAILIGLSQAVAIFPGVSRSGVTLTMGRGLKLSRQEILQYSFLMSMPVIVAAGVYEIPDYIKNFSVELIPWWIWGFLVSFLSGLLTIHLFLKMVGKYPLIYFTFYRLLLAGFLIFFN